LVERGKEKGDPAIKPHKQTFKINTKNYRIWDWGELKQKNPPKKKKKQKKKTKTREPPHWVPPGGARRRQ